MKSKLPNAAHVWKQLDDFVVPTLRLTVIERAVYSHLLRHTGSKAGIASASRGPGSPKDWAFAAKRLVPICVALLAVALSA